MHGLFEQLETRHVLQGFPILHSKAGAPHTFFLDFDGHVTRETSWNLELAEIHSPPFDIDGDPLTLNSDERERIISIWERVAEDFRPFDVDVTTELPTVLCPDNDFRSGIAQRVVITANIDSVTGNSWHIGDELGVSVRSWDLDSDTPAFVFSNHPLAGEIVSHELGHALGLSHDSEHAPNGPLIEYRGEHGHGETRWSPIMGQGNGLSQWSRGEYPDATNDELDIGILAATLGRRSDDYVGIHSLPASQIFHVAGVIEHAADVDIFSFVVDNANTRVSLSIEPWHNGPNLDIGVSLYGSAGNRIVEASDTTANPTDQLSSFIDVWLQPGQYFLQVDGVGKAATNDDPGYSDYGSLGYYRIDGEMKSVDLGSDYDRDRDVDFADFLILANSNYASSTSEERLNALMCSFGFKESSQPSSGLNKQ